MIKFATVEYGEIVLYTKHGNSTCYRKPIFEDRAEVITAKQFDEALFEALKAFRLKIALKEKIES